MNVQEHFEYLYQLTPAGNARLLAVRGSAPELQLPEEIEGHILTEIGAYCFSRSADVPAGGVWTRCQGNTFGSGGGEAFDDCVPMQSFCGNLVEAVYLPDTVTFIDRLAFYNCRNLREVSIGAGLTALGSDAFMNCRSLERICLRASLEGPSGISLILQQVRAHLEIWFCPRETTEAVLFYPEYTEGYDEIGPAHIFALQMEGEGFRARQCFRDQVVDVSAYDGVFPRIALEEKVTVAGKLALYRLAYPKGLTEEHRQRYEAYVRSHAAALTDQLVEGRSLSMLQLLCEKRLLTGTELSEVIVSASRMEWAEGAASLMQWQRQYYGNTGSGRYELDW